MIEDARVYHHRMEAAAVPADLDETYRYMGFARSVVLGKDGGIPAEVRQLVESSVGQMQAILKAQSVYICLPLEIRLSGQAESGGLSDSFGRGSGGNPDFSGIPSRADLPPVISFGGVEFGSRHLARNLAGCSRVILIASTIGPMADNLIRRLAKLDAAKAAIMQAAGAMFIESYLDQLNAQLEDEARKQGYRLHSRFSPGYGDVGLEVQRHFFSLLPCTQRIGLTLTDSLVMAPEKSVTAFIGMEPV